jgi:hypothetical protein
MSSQSITPMIVRLASVATAFAIVIGPLMLR